MRGGIDKGPCASYWQLSYRRKLIRTGWGVLIMMPLLCAVQMSGMLPRVLRLFMVPEPAQVGWALVAYCGFVCALQAWYNLHQWRREQRESRASEEG